MRATFVLLSTMIAVLGFSALLIMTPVSADETDLTDTFMADDENIELGRQLFQKRCKFCHGKGAYPGKAPKLKPKKLSTEQVYTRITYGFRAMPGWEHEFDDHERMSLTAYIKSPIFSN